MLYYLYDKLYFQSTEKGPMATTVYTYEIKMIVQVLNEGDETAARESLDQNGGYVTSRVVRILNSTELREVEG